MGIWALSGVYKTASTPLIAINPDKSSNPTVQGDAQTWENLPDARSLPNEDMSTADMSTLTHLFYIAKIRTDSQRKSASTYFFFQWFELTVAHDRQFWQGCRQHHNVSQKAAEVNLIHFARNSYAMNSYASAEEQHHTRYGTVTALVISRDFRPKLHFHQTTRWETGVRENFSTNTQPSELRGLWADGTNCCCLSYKAIPLFCRALTAHLCWEFRSPEIMCALHLSLSALPHTHLSVC